jgi:predicted dehydrogenase
MDRIFNWGILGTGRIAKKFAEGLKLAKGAHLLAVGSRSEETAGDFGQQFNIPRRYVGYQEMVNDPDLDIVYISSPHAMHFDHSLLAIRAGKAVLCEKPFTLNSAQAFELAQEARERRQFLMEGMWTRFFPLMTCISDLLSKEVLGEIHMLSADLGIRRSIESRDRLFKPELGGGSLLDVGVYPISLASMIFGEPDQVTGFAHFGEYGVDDRAAVVLGYPSGGLASLYMAIRTETPKEAVILGSNGSIRIHSNFVIPTRMTIHIEGEAERVIEKALEGNGMHYEAIEVMQCLSEGKTESAIMPLAESISIMKILDEIRDQWGFRYPSEK